MLPVFAPVAQRNRAPVFGTGCRGFESPPGVLRAQVIVFTANAAYYILCLVQHNEWFFEAAFPCPRTLSQQSAKNLSIPLADAYITFMVDREARQFTPKTLAYYRERLGDFFAYCTQTNVATLKR